jgi:hypothetical protein
MHFRTCKTCGEFYRTPIRYTLKCEKCKIKASEERINNIKLRRKKGYFKITKKELKKVLKCT